jgi:septum formation protein
LVLASRSPQRREMLGRLGLSFESVDPEIEELAEGEGREVALENARRKARRVAGQHRDAVVIGCDTVVAVGDHLLGKPRDEHAARESLLALSGREHLVLSGLCVAREGTEGESLTATRVAFRALEEPLLAWYLRTGEWRERAGGYAIQGRGAALVEGVEGDYSSVVGLPLPALLGLVPDLLEWSSEAPA